MVTIQRLDEEATYTNAGEWVGDSVLAEHARLLSETGPPAPGDPAGIAEGRRIAALLGARVVLEDVSGVESEDGVVY
jgi:hypothetical protein